MGFIYVLFLIYPTHFFVLRHVLQKFLFEENFTNRLVSVLFTFKFFDMSLFKVAVLLNIPNSISLYFTANLVLKIMYFKEICHSDYTFHKQKKKRPYLFSVIISLVSGICWGWKKSLPLVIKVSEFQADFLAYWFSLQRQSNFRLLTLLFQ